MQRFMFLLCHIMFCSATQLWHVVIHVYNDQICQYNIKAFIGPIREKPVQYDIFFRIGPIPVSPITTRSESAIHFDNCQEKSREILDWLINKGIIT